MPFTNTIMPTPYTPAHGNENLKRADTNTSARWDKCRRCTRDERAIGRECGGMNGEEKNTMNAIRRKSFISPARKIKLANKLRHIQTDTCVSVA